MQDTTSLPFSEFFLISDHCSLSTISVLNQCLLTKHERQLELYKSYNCQSLLSTLRFNDNSSVFFVLFLDIVALSLVLDLGYD